MQRRVRTLADLATLREALERESAARAEREREARLAEAVAQREASLFRDAIGPVEPLKVAARAQHAAARPAPIAQQYRRDEEAALAESLSSDFEPDTILDTDDQLVWRRTGIGPDVTRKLRRGHWIVQGELDLHGARVDEA